MADNPLTLGTRIYIALAAALAASMMTDQVTDGAVSLFTAIEKFVDAVEPGPATEALRAALPL